ncbi:MAG: TlpA family protein disulfide reductase [Dehalococcoidia bacterium]
MLLALLVVGLLVWQSCGGGGGEAASTISETADGGTATAAESALEIQALLATTDLGLGPNRISFLLLTPDGLITVPEVQVSSQYLSGGGSSSEPAETATARFHLWPFGTRGNYVTQLSFDGPGAWELDVKVYNLDGTIDTTRIHLEVKEVTATPALGSAPPLVENKTLDDIDSFEELTAWPRPDPELYQLTIPEAVASGKPLVVVFSSPGFCTSPTCGPQVDTVQELKGLYREQANFIHVEVYDNPIDIQQDLKKGRYHPAVTAWGLPDIEGYLNESWVFILDKSGRIAYKYEGYASIDELEKGLKSVF